MSLSSAAPSYIAERVTRLNGESAFAILSKAKALEAQGMDVIHLEIGQPDFQTPSNIMEAADRAMANGCTGNIPPVCQTGKMPSFSLCQQGLGTSFQHCRNPVWRSIPITRTPMHILFLHPFVENVDVLLPGAEDFVCVSAQMKLAFF